MNIEYVDIGVCGLSCRLCPMYNTDAQSRCEGCKSRARMAVGCPFITCAVRNKGVEFCWQCPESETCTKWQKHRQAGMQRDSFKCYQALESDIAYIGQNGVEKLSEQQSIRAGLLREMLAMFNDGRPKSYYCIAATVMNPEELEEALDKAKALSEGKSAKERAKILHGLLDGAAARQGYHLALRK